MPAAPVRDAVGAARETPHHRYRPLQKTSGVLKTQRLATRADKPWDEASCEEDSGESNVGKDIFPTLELCPGGPRADCAPSSRATTTTSFNRRPHELPASSQDHKGFKKKVDREIAGSTISLGEVVTLHFSLASREPRGKETRSFYSLRGGI